MKLKEFVDKGGVVTLNNAGDLQEVVRYAEKVGYPVANSTRAVVITRFSSGYRTGWC